MTAGILIFLFQKGLVFKRLAARCALWRENAANGVYDLKACELSPEKAALFAELDALYRLKISGAVSEEEYETKKQAILEKIG